MRIYSYKPPQVSSSAQPPRRGSRRFHFHFRWPGRWNWKKILTWAFRLFALGVFCAALLFLYYAKDLPDPNKLLQRSVPESTKIYARDGSLLYEIHGEYKRTLITLDQVPPYAKEATIAIEDKDFYKEGGISFTGIFRAALADLISLRKAQGASTITQQFVKNAILSDNKSWDRKIRELILAVAIDSRFSKDQILQLYLNEIPYGRNAYGIEAASETYFNKPASQLDLAESAYLASLVQAPTYYNPAGPHRSDLDARKNTVLTLMQQQGYITSQQEQAAKDETVNFSEITNGIKAPHFVLWVEDYLANKYGEKTLEEGGLQVYTTLDPKLQDIAETVVKNDVDKESSKYNAHNAALVAIDPKTGQILAMVGSKDYFGTPEPAGCTPGKNCWFEPNVNVALSQRQPGSSFKPYVYGTAFKKGFNYAPASMLMDVVTDFGSYNGKDYIPHNYNNQSYGPVSMRKAMAGSLNVPAVKTLALVGVDNAVQTARDLGITSPLQDCGLSLVLGGCEVRLLDHVASYAAIANEGVKNPETPILKVLDKDNNVLEQYQSKPQAVLDPQAAYELISIMTDNSARSFVFGANSPLILPDRAVAAKTGTTQNWHDGWTLGFTPSLAAGVWAGNNDGTLLKQGADGVVVAAPIWHDFMQQALAGTPAEDFAVPSGIQQVTVDAVSGKLPTSATPVTKTDVFADYAVPTEYDNVHVKVAYDALTGQPATSLTPPSQMSYKVFTVFHSEMPQNPNWENPVEQWALAQGYVYPPDDAIVSGDSAGSGNNGPGPTAAILNPASGQTITSLPLSVTVSALADSGIARVDLSIDGEFYQSLSQEPFVFTVNKKLDDGSHALAAHVVDKAGATSDTSVDITVDLSSPLTLTQPAAQSLVQFPLLLSANSSNQYSTVNFYYQNDKGQSKLIGPAGNVDNAGSGYRYTLTWQAPPPAGVYSIFAQSNDGAVTKKVSISVP
ncbi:MAG TPA: PBP1A family penicillin-binding protein [Patescibacteria group bacterium]|nr:PBP1A family penicillin-binding protein [Patescibacteria group bacterium]